MRRSYYGVLLALVLAGAALTAWWLSPSFAARSERSTAVSASVTATATTTLTPSPRPTATASPTPAPTSTPTATPTPVPVTSRAIFVDQNAQQMHIYENEVEIRVLPCSTGKPLDWHWTPAWSGRVGSYVGTFASYGAYQDDAWYLFKATGDILIHGAPYTVVDGEKVYQDLDALGTRPSSHGCIRLAPEDARWLTEWDPLDVPIAITDLTRTSGW